MAIFNSLEDCNKAIVAMEAANLEIPPTFLEEKERLEVEQRINEEELIFSTMAAHNKFMTPEKEHVVREMTDQLKPNTHRPTPRL